MAENLNQPVSFQAPSVSRNKRLHSAPKYHRLPLCCGGLNNLIEAIKDGTFNKGDGSCFTDVEGSFAPQGNVPLLAKRYRCLKVLGRGVSAVVIRARDTFRQNHQVAIKIMNVRLFSLGCQEANRTRCLNQADSQGISGAVRLLNTFELDGHFCMVYELLNPKPLHHYFERLLPTKKLPLIKKVAIQLIKTLGFLQSQDVIHADMKPENILCADGDLNGKIKLIDFGNAIHCIYDELSLYYNDYELQTIVYRAPEVMCGLQFGPEVDMWSVGCILAELYIGEPLFYALNKAEMLARIHQLLGPFPAHIYQRGKFYRSFRHLGGPPQSYVESYNKLRTRLMDTTCGDFVSFILGFLQYDAGERMTVQQAFQHPFLASEAGIGLTLLTEQGSVTPGGIGIRPSEYMFSPHIPKEVKAKKLDSIQLLRQGTTASAPSSQKHPKAVAQVLPFSSRDAKGEVTDKAGKSAERSEIVGNSRHSGGGVEVGGSPLGGRQDERSLTTTSQRGHENSASVSAAPRRIHSLNAREEYQQSREENINLSSRKPGSSREDLENLNFGFGIDDHNLGGRLLQGSGQELGGVNTDPPIVRNAPGREGNAPEFETRGRSGSSVNTASQRTSRRDVKNGLPTRNSIPWIPEQNDEGSGGLHQLANQEGRTEDGLRWGGNRLEEQDGNYLMTAASSHDPPVTRGRSVDRERTVGKRHCETSVSHHEMVPLNTKQGCSSSQQEIASYNRRLHGSSEAITKNSDLENTIECNRSGTKSLLSKNNDGSEPPNYTRIANGDSRGSLSGLQKGINRDETEGEQLVEPFENLEPNVKAEFGANETHFGDYRARQRPGVSRNKRISLVENNKTVVAQSKQMIRSVSDGRNDGKPSDRPNTIQMPKAVRNRSLSITQLSKRDPADRKSNSHSFAADKDLFRNELGFSDHPSTSRIPTVGRVDGMSVAQKTSGGQSKDEDEEATSSNRSEADSSAGGSKTGSRSLERDSPTPGDWRNLQHLTFVKDQNEYEEGADIHDRSCRESISSISAPGKALPLFSRRSSQKTSSEGNSKTMEIGEGKLPVRRVSKTNTVKNCLGSIGRPRSRNETWNEPAMDADDPHDHEPPGLGENSTFATVRIGDRCVQEDQQRTRHGSGPTETPGSAENVTDDPTSSEDRGLTISGKKRLAFEIYQELEKTDLRDHPIKRSKSSRQLDFGGVGNSIREPVTEEYDKKPHRPQMKSAKKIVSQLTADLGKLLEENGGQPLEPYLRSGTPKTKTQRNDENRDMDDDVSSPGGMANNPVEKNGQALATQNTKVVKRANNRNKMPEGMGARHGGCERATGRKGKQVESRSRDFDDDMNTSRRMADNPVERDSQALAEQKTKVVNRVNNKNRMPKGMGARRRGCGRATRRKGKQAKSSNTSGLGDDDITSSTLSKPAKIKSSAPVSGKIDQVHEVGRKHSEEGTLQGTGLLLGKKRSPLPDSEEQEMERKEQNYYKSLQAVGTGRGKRKACERGKRMDDNSPEPEDNNQARNMDRTFQESSSHPTEDKGRMSISGPKRNRGNKGSVVEYKDMQKSPVVKRKPVDEDEWHEQDIAVGMDETDSVSEGSSWAEKVAFSDEERKECAKMLESRSQLGHEVKRRTVGDLKRSEKVQVVKDSSDNDHRYNYRDEARVALTEPETTNVHGIVGVRTNDSIPGSSEDIRRNMKEEATSMKRTPKRVVRTKETPKMELSRQKCHQTDMMRKTPSSTKRGCSGEGHQRTATGTSGIQARQFVLIKDAVDIADRTSKEGSESTAGNHEDEHNIIMAKKGLLTRGRGSPQANQSTDGRGGTVHHQDDILLISPGRFFNLGQQEEWHPADDDYESDESLSSESPPLEDQLVFIS